MLIIDHIFHAGTITKTHGFSGQLKVILQKNLKLRQEPEGTVFLIINKKAVPFFIEGAIISSDSSFTLKLEDVNTIEAAKELLGLDVCFNNKQKKLFEQTELHAAFLQGYTLFNQENMIAGQITDIIDNPGHFLLELDHDKLIPFHEELIIRINPDERTVYLQIADGLLDE